jgi:hypothetical protein
MTIPKYVDACGWLVHSQTLKEDSYAHTIQSIPDPSFQTLQEFK